MDRYNTCCFTGHREIDKKDLPSLKRNLKKTVISLVKEGTYNFVAGGALGFDTIAALTVLELREHYPVTLTVVSPFLGQADRFSPKDKRIFEEIKNLADDFIVIRMNYQKGCMQERNCCMVDMSSTCVAYLRDRASGTGQTVSYAKKNNLRIINLYKDENQMSLF